MEAPVVANIKCCILQNSCGVHIFIPRFKESRARCPTYHHEPALLHWRKRVPDRDVPLGYRNFNAEKWDTLHTSVYITAPR